MHTRTTTHLQHTSSDQLLHREATVMYKLVLAQPSANNSHNGVGGGRHGGCEPLSRVVDELLVLLLL